jgi:hypothetical protein
MRLAREVFVMSKKILLGLALLFIAIQFVRPAKNISPTLGPDDATIRYPTSPAVKQLLTTACYDCHSNHTRYPWYTEVQPVGWWMAEHVHDAKHAFNFSELGAYSTKAAVHRLDASIDEVVDRSMPLLSYRIAHADARLTNAQIKLLTDWLEETRDLIQEEGAGTKPAVKPALPSAR